MYVFTYMDIDNRYDEKALMGYLYNETWIRCPGGVMAKAMDCGIVVSEFELQSRYYIHFRINDLEKGMKPYPPSYGLNSIATVLLEGLFWH